MIVDVDEIKRHMKPKADSTLRNMKKDDLIAYIRTLEHNYNVAQSFLDQQARNFAEYAPVVHGRWNSQPYYKADGKGGVFKYCDFYYCSECKTERPIVPPFNYCPNCGAKMDGDPDV